MNSIKNLTKIKELTLRTSQTCIYKSNGQQIRYCSDKRLNSQDSEKIELVQKIDVQFNQTAAAYLKQFGMSNIKNRFLNNFLILYRMNSISPKLNKDQFVNTCKEDHKLPVVTQEDELAIKNLTDLQFKSSEATINKNLINSWLKLSKFRLTSLVVLTTLTGHYMGLTTFDPQLMFYTLLGTGLCSSSAAALNQFLEIPYDSQMSRTKNRPLVTHNVTPLHAFTFATITGLSGFLTLALNVNMLTASLGALNLVLYSFVYTPMKRFNIVNTWIGSIVGAIPPIMGYTAATGSIDISAICLGLILYSWQFPHFNALSWNIKHDYARAGYRMMVVTNPDLCVRTAFRHSWLIALYCELMCTNQIGLDNWTFGFDSLPVNIYLIYLAWKFKQNPNAKTSRTLFKFSLVHLPVLLTLLVLSKKSKKDKPELTVV